jgi:hypothetical protein
VEATDNGVEPSVIVLPLQENVVSALPHDSHFMGILLAEISALSTCHPEQNPALAGQDVYKDKEIVDKQILRLIGGPVSEVWC